MNAADRIAARLPPGEELSHVDVMIAFNVTHPTVTAWRERGEFHGQCINKGAGKHEKWFYMRDAVIAFAKRRVG